MKARPWADDRGQVGGLPAHHDRKRFIEITLFWANVLLLALIVRLPWTNIITWDYILYLEGWYTFIVDNGHFAAFKYDFYDYNPTYLYLLSLGSLLLPNLKGYIVIKGISIIFDFVLAFFVYKCVSLKYSRSKVVPCLAALVTLFFPTVILNSSAWGQCDSIFSSFLVACLYAHLSGRQIGTFVAFGLSFIFKPQAVFLMPFFLWLLVKKQVSGRYFFWSLLVYVVAILPAWAIGRPLGSLLLIYFNLNVASDQDLLTENAPNLYQWIPNRYFSWYPVGVVFAAIVVIVIALLVYKSRVEMTDNLVIYLATFSVLLMPFILPKMHDRYYFTADIIAIILAFYLPKYWYAPVIIGMTSLLVYLRYLFDMRLIPLTWLALFPLALIAVMGWQLLRTLGHLPPSRKPPDTADSERQPYAAQNS